MSGAPDNKKDCIPSVIDNGGVVVTRRSLPSGLSGDALERAVKAVEDWEFGDDANPVNLVLTLYPILKRG